MDYTYLVKGKYYKFSTGNNHYILRYNYKNEYSKSIYWFTIMLSNNPVFISGRSYALSEDNVKKLKEL